MKASGPRARGSERSGHNEESGSIGQRSMVLVFDDAHLLRAIHPNHFKKSLGI